MQFGTPVPLLIGLILIIGAVVLFFLDKFKPGYGRDSDKVYSVLLLVAGMCALGELQLGIFPSFQLLIMAGMLLTLLIENVRNREPLEPARPGGGMPPRGGRPRPVDRRPAPRRPVQAELYDRDRLDEWGEPRTMAPSRPYDDDRYRSPYDDRPPMRRLNPGEPVGQYDGPPNFRKQQPPERPNDRPDNRLNDRPPERPPERPAPRPSDNYGPPAEYRNDYRPRSRNAQPPRDDYPNGRPSIGRPTDGPAPDNRPSEPSRPEGRRTERTLDVRPYSEAPRAQSGDQGEDYVDFRPVDTDGPKDDSDW